MLAIDGCLLWVDRRKGATEVEGVSRSTCAVWVPIDQVLARDLRVGDVVRVHDPQAHRVGRVMIVDGRVVLEVRPVGLSVPGTVRLDLPADAAVETLVSAAS